MKKNLDGGDNLRGGETILTQVDQRVQHPEHDRDDPDDDDDGWYHDHDDSWWIMMIADDDGRDCDFDGSGNNYDP